MYLRGKYIPSPDVSPCPTMSWYSLILTVAKALVVMLAFLSMPVGIWVTCASNKYMKTVLTVHGKPVDHWTKSSLKFRDCVWQDQQCMWFWIRGSSELDYWLHLSVPKCFVPSLGFTLCPTTSSGSAYQWNGTEMTMCAFHGTLIRRAIHYVWERSHDVRMIGDDGSFKACLQWQVSVVALS